MEETIVTKGLLSKMGATSNKEGEAYFILFFLNHIKLKFNF